MSIAVLQCCDILYFLFYFTISLPPVWQHTFVSPSAFSRRAVVSYWRKYVHEVLVNRLGGLSLPRKSVVRLTDRSDMTLDVYRGLKTTIQQYNNHLSTQQAHYVEMTSYRRRCDVMTSHRRQYDVISTLCACWVGTIKTQG